MANTLAPLKFNFFSNIQRNLLFTPKPISEITKKLPYSSSSWGFSLLKVQIRFKNQLELAAT